MEAKIIATGSYLPPKVMTNFDLEKLVDTSDEWISSRTGIKERRIAEESCSSMGAKAAKAALQKARMDVQEIDLILAMTMTPDYTCPSTAALIQEALGARNVGAMDVQAACSGYVYGLSIAKAYVESGMAKNVLVVVPEKMSSVTDFSDRNTCVIFGDGAAACIVGRSSHGLTILSSALGSDGSASDLFMIPAGGSTHPTTFETVKERKHFIKMKGQELFKAGVLRMASVADESLQKAGLTYSDIAYLVPHQANDRMMEAMAKHLRLPSEKVYKTIHKYGNTSGSSIGIALDELLDQSKVSVGDNLLLVAFGAGLTWGSTLLRQT